MTVITHDKYSAVFYCKGDSIEEYWEYILNALVYTEGDGKGHRPDLIVDDGGDMTILIHEGKKSEELLIKDVTIHEPRSMDNVDFKISQIIIKCQLEGGEKDKWNKIVNTCVEVFEETSTGVHHLYYMENTGIDHKK